MELLVSLDCPYVLIGDPVAIAATAAERAERIGLGAVVLPEGPDLAEVVPALRRAPHLTSRGQPTRSQAMSSSMAGLSRPPNAPASGFSMP